NLNELNLASNKISTIHVGAFQNLHKLQVLNLENNNLKYVDSVFKLSVFRPLRSLKVLLLNRNIDQDEHKTRYPDAALSNLVSLKELRLDGLTNQSFGEGFSNLTHLTHLSLAGQNGYCKLIGLFNTTFTHVSHLKLLNLSHCDIRHIEPAAFVPLRSTLDVLDLSYNQKLKFNNVFNGSFGWEHSKLRVLNISHIVGPHEICVVITKDNFKYMRNTSIEEIYADGNRIQLFETGALVRLPSTLRKVSMKSSWFAVGEYILEIVSIKNLIELDLSGIAGSRSLPIAGLDYLTKCNQQNCFEDDEDIDISCGVSRMAGTERNSRITNMGNGDTEIASLLDNINPGFFIPPNLQILKYTFEELAFQISPLTISDNNLTVLNASYNLLSSWIGPVIGLNKLTNLDLSNNIAFRAHPKFFENFPSLIILNISNNLLNNAIANDTSGALFTNLTSVQILDLSANHLQKIPEHLFKGLSSLQVLKLSYNNLVYVPMHVKHMTNLEKIDFASNKIRWLPKTLMSELDSLIETRNCSIAIDLSHNPISCECPNLTFLKWMRHTRVRQVEMAYYYCLNADGHTVNLTDLPAIVDSLEAACTNHKYIALTAFLFIIAFLLVFSALYLYIHRWRARYWYYGIRYSFRSSQSGSDARQNRFPFDAFISYADEDKTLIEEEMSEMVETRGGKKLILHRRDFLLGMPIIHNILESIKRSRKTVLVLSSHFLKSSWCEYEMQLAIQESAHTGRDVLLVLKLEDIPHEKLPKNILQLLQKDLYLEYQHEENNQLFWQRFINKIEET
ncbi:toll-like receptor 4, partial [Gigantopelta aegis]|uniref:toll-like receptor 4 n=1 Tax=Gigantopelta aegis TaxID=1735272 RepID=UPI001B88E118